MADGQNLDKSKKPAKSDAGEGNNLSGLDELKSGQGLPIDQTSSGRFIAYVPPEQSGSENASVTVVPPILRSGKTELARDAKTVPSGTEVISLSQAAAAKDVPVAQVKPDGAKLQPVKPDTNASEIAWRDAELAKARRADEIAAQERAMHEAMSGRRSVTAEPVVPKNEPPKINSNDSEIAWRTAQLNAAKEQERIAAQERLMHSSNAGRLLEPAKPETVTARDGAVKQDPRTIAAAEPGKLDAKGARPETTQLSLNAATPVIDRKTSARADIATATNTDGARPLKQNTSAEAPHPVSNNTKSILDGKIDAAPTASNKQIASSSETVKTVDKTGPLLMRVASSADINILRQISEHDKSVKSLLQEKQLPLQSLLLTLRSTTQVQSPFLDAEKRKCDLVVQHGSTVSVGAPLAVLLRSLGSSNGSTGGKSAFAVNGVESTIAPCSVKSWDRIVFAGNDGGNKIKAISAMVDNTRAMLSVPDNGNVKGILAQSLIPKGNPHQIAGTGSDARGPAYVATNNGIKAVATQIAFVPSAKGSESSGNPLSLGRPLTQTIEPVGGRIPPPVPGRVLDAVRYIPAGLQADSANASPSKLGSRIASLHGIDERRMPGVEIVMGALITSTAIAKARRGNHASERVESQDQDGRKTSTWLDVVLQEQLRKRKVEQAQKFGGELSQAELEKLHLEDTDALEKDPIIFALQLFNDHLKAARERYKKEPDSKAEKAEQEGDKVESGSNSAFVNWQEQTKSGATREKYLVDKDENLERLAETLYNDRRVAWLIADLNRDRIKDNAVDEQRVVELFVGQTIELPNLDEVQKFLQETARKSLLLGRLVTIVSITSENASVIRDILGKII